MRRGKLRIMSPRGVYTMYDLIIIGAGPGGLALAAEACASGIIRSQILVLE